MTNRELLELAAKAIGLTLDFDNAQWGRPWADKCGYWNPLTDDGDALRLAVKLRLHVSVFADAIGIGTPGAGYVEDRWNNDPYAATRRAITKAAAEIGSPM